METIDIYDSIKMSRLSRSLHTEYRIVEAQAQLDYNYPLMGTQGGADSTIIRTPTLGVKKDVKIIEKNLDDALPLRVVMIENRTRDLFGIDLLKMKRENELMVFRARRAPYCFGHLVLAYENHDFRSQELQSDDLALFLHLSAYMPEYTFAFNSMVGTTSPDSWHCQLLPMKLPVFSTPIASWPCTAYRWDKVAEPCVIQEVMDIYRHSQRFCEILVQSGSVIAVPRKEQVNPPSLAAIHKFSPFGMFEISGLHLASKTDDAFNFICKPGVFKNALQELSV
jgi:hypothetical protein